jgi:mRNA interferase MazF
MGFDGVAMVIKRFEVFMIQLDPTIGIEMQKTRPCVVISPDVLNRYLGTVIVAPLTTTAHRPYHWRVTVHFQGKEGQIAIDQMRAVDKSRMLKRLGRITNSESGSLLVAIADLFAE